MAVPDRRVRIPWSSHSSEMAVSSQKASSPQRAESRNMMTKESAQKATNIDPWNRLAGGSMP